MTRTSAELILLAVLVVAAGFTLSHGLRSPAPAGSGTAPAAPVADPVGGGLGERARLLRERLSSPPGRVPVKRNPFAFPSARPADAAPVSEARPAVDAAMEAARPELTLSGIAEDVLSGTTVRTAVIVASGQLVFVKEGDRVLARYLVMQIAPDAVQLKDTERGEVFTLAFK